MHQASLVFIAIVVLLGCVPEAGAIKTKGEQASPAPLFLTSDFDRSMLCQTDQIMASESGNAISFALKAPVDSKSVPLRYSRHIVVDTKCALKRGALNNCSFLIESPEPFSLALSKNSPRHLKLNFLDDVKHVRATEGVNPTVEMLNETNNMQFSDHEFKFGEELIKTEENKLVFKYSNNNSFNYPSPLFNYASPSGSGFNIKSDISTIGSYFKKGPNGYYEIIRPFEVHSYNRNAWAWRGFSAIAPASRIYPHTNVAAGVSVSQSQIGLNPLFRNSFISPDFSVQIFESDRPPATTLEVRQRLLNVNCSRGPIEKLSSIDSDGMLIRVYSRQGANKGPIIYLHGGPGNFFDPRYPSLLIQSLLMDGYELHVPSLPGSVGNGRELAASLGIGGTSEVGKFGEKLARYVKKLGEEKKISVLGESFGAVFAFDLASRVDRKDVTFILIGPFIKYINPNEYRSGPAVLFQSNYEKVFFGYNSIEERSDIWNAYLDNSHRMLTQYQLERLHLVFGERDNLSRLEWLPNSVRVNLGSVKIVPGGHQTLSNAGMTIDNVFKVLNSKN